MYEIFLCHLSPAVTKQVFLSCTSEGKMELPCLQPSAVNDGCFKGKGQCRSRSQKKIVVI